MSVRYGIDLVLQPSFTARVYQVRQIVCGQYSAWAAEMQMLRMALTPYFVCPDEHRPHLLSLVEEIADSVRKGESFVLTPQGIVPDPAMNGVVLEFDAPQPLCDLRRVALECAGSHDSGIDLHGQFRPRVALLEYGAFPSKILPDAAEFARGVADGLGIGDEARPWRLLLTQYSSDAAAVDWSNGSWAVDLSWQQLASHSLNDN